MFLENTAPPSPKSVLFANSIAAESSLTLNRLKTGPNISSLAAVDLIGIFSSTVIGQN